MKGAREQCVDSRRQPNGSNRFATIRSFLPRNAGPIRVPLPRCSDISAPFAVGTLDPGPVVPVLPFPPFLFLSLSFFFFFLHFTALFILPVRGRNEVDEVSPHFPFCLRKDGGIG